MIFIGIISPGMSVSFTGAIRKELLQYDVKKEMRNIILHCFSAPESMKEKMITSLARGARKRVAEVVARIVRSPKE